MKTKRCKVKKIKDSTKYSKHEEGSAHEDRTGLRDFDVQDMLRKDNLDSFLGIPDKIMQKRVREKRLNITLSTDQDGVEITITFKPGAKPKWIRS